MYLLSRRLNKYSIIFASSRQWFVILILLKRNARLFPLAKLSSFVLLEIESLLTRPVYRKLTFAIPRACTIGQIDPRRLPVKSSLKDVVSRSDFPSSCLAPLWVRCLSTHFSVYFINVRYQWRLNEASILPWNLYGIFCCWLYVRRIHC